MKKISLHSISAKYFFATALLIVFPICIFYQFFNSYNSNTALAQKRISDLSTLNTLSASINNNLASISAVTSLVAADADIKDYLRESEKLAENYGKAYYKNMDNTAYLKPYSDTLDSILSFTLMDSDFYIIGEQRLDRDRLNYFFHSSNLDEIKTDPQSPVWTKTFSVKFCSSQSVHKVFSLLYPTCDDKGTVLGYVVAFVDTSKFFSILDSYDDIIYVIEGNIIIGTKKNLSLNTNLFSEMHINYTLLLEDDSVIVKNNSDTVIITTRFFEPLDFHLLLTSSYHELEQQQTAGLSSILTVVIYIIILSMLMAVMITHFQTKHIVELTNVMNKIKEGNLSIRYQPKTKDEIATLGTTFNSLLDRIQELMQQQKKHQKTKRKMELQMIQEQVKPHLLYNMLEMINSMIRCGMTEESMSVVEKLAGFYRISLNHGSDMISVFSEFQLIDKYLSLQKMRYIEFMDYVLALSPEIHNYIIPKLTLQPLVENSIYHGIKENDEKGIICVSGYLEQNQVILEVFDTGTGIPAEKLQHLQEMINTSATEPEDHFGLISVIQRLNIHYNDQASLHIDSVYGEYTCITIKFPAIEK